MDTRKLFDNDEFVELLEDKVFQEKLGTLFKVIKEVVLDQK